MQVTTDRAPQLVAAICEYRRAFLEHRDAGTNTRRYNQPEVSYLSFVKNGVSAWYIALTDSWTDATAVGFYQSHRKLASDEQIVDPNLLNGLERLLALCKKPFADDNSFESIRC